MQKTNERPLRAPLFKQFNLLFSLFFIVSFIATLLPISALATPTTKKNLCSITINSDNEIQAFKKNLSSDHWNFIELIPGQHAGQNPNFLPSYCRKDISCDMLIISGHFSGVFVGSSGWSLPIETMESLSCNSACDGIFKRPQEVFLFGCNTLSTRDSVHANPEALLAHLESRGFSRLQAAQVMEFRATQFGSSMKDRMRAVFPNADAIYGFPKIAPTGPQIETALTGYLKDSDSRYNSSVLSLSLAPEKNYYYKQHLAQKDMFIADGLKDDNEIKRPYCFFENPQLGIDKKLDFIEKLFNENLAIQSLSHIQKAIKQAFLTQSMPAAQLQERLKHIASLPATKDTLQKVLTLKGEAFILFKGKTLQLLRDLEIISSAEFYRQKTELLDLKIPFTKVKSDLVCGTDLQISITFDQVPKQRWQEESFINALGCIKPVDPLVYRHLLSMTEDLPRNSLIRSSIFAILSNRINFEPDVQADLVKIFEAETQTNNRQLIAMALGKTKPLNKSITTKIALLANSERNPYIKTILERIISN